jgi:hypothetical protein
MAPDGTEHTRDQSLTRLISPRSPVHTDTGLHLHKTWFEAKDDTSHVKVI